LEVGAEEELEQEQE
jgi:hypothetical protein